MNVVSNLEGVRNINWFFKLQYNDGEKERNVLGYFRWLGNST